MTFSRKKIISVVLFLILLISIPIGLYLVKQTQDARSRASSAENQADYIGLPWNDIRLDQGKIKIKGEWVYLKTAWLIIDFGPTGAYGYVPCPVAINAYGIKVVDQTCMFFGRENPEEYLQYPRLLKERGFNSVKVTAYWDFFDRDGDGRIDDNTALENMKRLMTVIRDEGMFISFQVINYPVGGGGVPTTFFNSHPGAQAMGIPGRSDSTPDLSKDLKGWTDCGYKSPDPNLNSDNSLHPGWPPNEKYECNYETGANLERYPKIPSIHSQVYQDTSKKFIEELLNGLGSELIKSILVYETSVEPMYNLNHYLDYSDNARVAFENYIKDPANNNEARTQGCLTTLGALVWNMTSSPKQLCQDISFQMTNPTSIWNKFRAKALAEYINLEAKTIKDSVNDLAGREIANRIIVGADVLDISPAGVLSSITVLGNRDEYLRNLQGINLLQVNWNWYDGPISGVYSAAKSINPNWAISEHMSYEPGGLGGVDDDENNNSRWINNIWQNSTNFGLEIFHPRPVSADNAFSKYPNTYANSWTIYNNDWNPKPSFDNISTKLFSTGNNGQFPVNKIKDFYPPNPDSPIRPKLKDFNLGRDNQGYYFVAKSIDNHLLGRYDLWVIRVGDNKSDLNNWISLSPVTGKVFENNIYKENQRKYFSTRGARYQSGGSVDLDPNQEYEFVINTFDYAGNACEFGSDGSNYNNCAQGGRNTAMKAIRLAALSFSGGPTPTPRATPPVPVVTPPSSPGGTASPVNRRPVGFFDGIENTSCKASGWAKDEDTPNQSVKIHVYKDVADDGSGGTWLAEFTAGEVRSDVGGNFGYNITLPLQDNRDHKIAIYGLDANGENNNTLLAGSPKTIHCPAPASVIQSIIQLFGGTGDQSQGDQNGDGKINELDFGSVYSK